MNTFQPVTLRQRIERACAAALSISAVGLLAYGWVAMCVQPELLA